MIGLEELMVPCGEYRLANVSLAVNRNTVRWSATLEGPTGAQVWASMDLGREWDAFRDGHSSGGGG